MEIGFNTQASEIPIVVGNEQFVPPPALRLYPNPTSTSFTLELPEPATPGTSFRIAGLTGQTLLQQRAEAGSKLHVFDLSALPAGMYFVQVWKEGSVVGVGKVVRQ